MLSFQHDLVAHFGSRLKEVVHRTLDRQYVIICNIILSSGLSEIFCLKNLLGGFPTHWFDDDV